MDQQTAREEIRTAIRQLERNIEPEAQQAYEFLKNLPDTYTRAVDAFRAGLNSSNGDVQVVSALALGRMGRGVHWVPDALISKLQATGPDTFIANALGSALSSLRSPGAATALAKAATSALETTPLDPARVITFLQPLADLGAFATPHLELFDRAKVLWRDNSINYFPTASYLLQLIHENVASDYREFRTAQTESPSIRLGLDEIRLRCIERLGASEVLFDGRCEYFPQQIGIEGVLEAGERFDIARMWKERSLEARCVVVKLPINEIICFGVWDMYSNNTLMNRFESFASGLCCSLQDEITEDIPVRFAIFQPNRPHLDGGFDMTGVEMEEGNGSFSVTNWINQDVMLEWLGDDAAALCDYLDRSPTAPEGFVEYCDALAHDRLTRERYDAQRAASPEGRLHYDALSWEFSDEVARILKGATNQRSTQPYYGDSIDLPHSAASLPETIPESLKHFFDEMAQRRSLISEGQDDDSLTFEVIETDSGVILAGKTRHPIESDPEFPDELLAKTIPSYAMTPPPTGDNSIGISAREVGIVLVQLRSRDLILTNVPATVQGNSDGFLWGYSGAGPCELALNILNLFVPPGSDGQPERERHSSFNPPTVRTFASATATRLTRQFMLDILKPLHKQYAAFLSAERIKDWITTHLK